MRIYLESVDSDWYNQRLTRVLLIILVAFAITISRLLYLQAIEGKEYRRQSEINSIRLHSINAPRGLIFDRHEHLMVDNRPSFNLYIVLKDAKPLQSTLAKLSQYLGEPIENLEAAIKNSKQRGGYKPILLKEDVGRDILAVIEVNKFDLPGVEVHISPRRDYLFHERASHLIGYMGEISPAELQCEPYADCKGGDFIGKFGIEKAFGEILRGKRGGRQVEVNATGQVVRVLETVAAQAGENIHLTIDENLQKTAEELMRNKAGAAVAVDPNNGEILAMASSPAFDPNLFVTGMTREQWHDIISNPHRTL
jgi:penicillin-binding protein 2